MTKKKMKKRGGTIDIPLFAVMLIMIAFGLIMVFSASAPSAFIENGDKLYYIKRQLLWTVIGFGVMLFTMNVDYRTVKRFAPLLCGGAFVLLLLVLFIGSSGGGAQRWIAFGPIRFQPSELAKFALVLYFAKRISEKPKDNLQKFAHGSLPYMLILCAFVGVTVAQKHLSGATVIFAAGMLVLFAGGARAIHLTGMAAVGAVGIYILALIEPYRMKRLMVFKDPFADKLGDGWQIVQGLYAIGSGGLFGVGLGQSRQKFLYIPEAHNDYIYAIICEELGWFGAILVAILFVLFIWRGIHIAINSPDTFAGLTVFGITGIIALQYVINVAVVTASIPNTGMQLPFFSAGGSSLIFIMAAMGVVFNISRQAKKKQEPVVKKGVTQ